MVISRGAMDALTQIQNAVTNALGFDQVLRLGTLFLALFRYDAMNNEAYPMDTRVFLPEYDFVVIGGGAAGSVVASRLTENPAWNVLLLEAGGEEDEVSEIPALWAFQMGSEHDWKYQTTPSESGYCQAMKGKRCNWPRGKVLGGSSSINGLLYIRGNKHDYDQWAKQGNSGWSYEEVLPYFLKSENNSNAKYTQTRYHSYGGYLGVQDSQWRTPLAKAFLDGGEELGYKVQDINGESQTGFMFSQGTVRDGSRCSASRAFLRPVRHRPNLHVSKNSFVTKIAIDAATKKAHGVHFVKGNKKYRIRAKNEVILSAGTTSSPQILMLSGVGIREHLEKHKIPIINELSVGNNLQDHLGVALTFVVEDPVAFTSARYGSVPYILQYVTNKNGPFSTINAESVAFVNTKYANVSQDWPDMQLHFSPAGGNSGGDILSKAQNHRRDIYETLYKPLGDADTWSITPTLVRPRSRGTIRLRSSNPFHHPEINPNYLTDRRDVETLLEGIRFGLKLGNTAAFKKYKNRLHKIPIPGCERIEFDTDEYWECALRHLTTLFAHSVGTCKMGPRSDPGAVVDDRLRVYGIKGLRVIDASVMPTIITGNTNSASIMIGEKGADMVKEDWKYARKA